MPSRKVIPMREWRVDWGSSVVKIKAPSKYAAKKMAKAKYLIAPNTMINVTELPELPERVEGS